MADSTAIPVHWTLTNAIESLRRGGGAVEVVDGPFGPVLPPDETDDGRDTYVDDLLEAGLAGELSWIEFEQLAYGVFRNG